MGGFQHARSRQVPGLVPGMHLDGQPDGSFGQFARKAVWSARLTVSQDQAFNTEDTKDHGAARRKTECCRAQPSFGANPIIGAGAGCGSSPEVSLQTQRRRALVHPAGTLHSLGPVPWGKVKNLPISPAQTESRLPAGCAGTSAR